MSNDFFFMAPWNYKFVSILMTKLKKVVNNCKCFINIG